MKSSKERLTGYLIFAVFFGYIAARFAKMAQADYHGNLSQMFQLLADDRSFINQPFDFHLTMWGLFAFVIGFGIVMLVYLAKTDNREYMEGKQHGTARRAKIPEFKNFKNKEFQKNVLFTQHIRLSRVASILKKKYKRNNNTLTLGSSGTYKTYRLVKVNLAQAYGSYVVTDSKGQTIRETGQFFEKKGYEVKVFDLIAKDGNCDGFNPFHYVWDEATLRTLLALIIKGTDEGAVSQGDPFWEKSEVVLAESLMGYCYNIAKHNGEEAKLYQVAEMVGHLRPPDKKSRSTAELMFDNYEKVFGVDDYYAKKFRKFIESYKGATLDSVICDC
jgi:type IV secretion system protein VirD4